MSARSSLHTHATLCDGTDTLETMAAAAYEAGVAVYGVTCHSHTPAPFDVGQTLDADLTRYCAQVAQVQKQYAGKMEVLLGLELDATSDCQLGDLDGLDYWIGSVHNLYDPVTHTYHAIDWDGEKLEACIHSQFGGDAMAMVAEYYRMVGQIAKKKPTILGHFDLVVKLNQNNRFFDETSQTYKNLALETLAGIDETATVLEVNCGALAKYGRIYPAPFVLQAWQARGGRIVLTSDAHSASTIVSGYDQGMALAKKCGFSKHWILRNGEWLAVPLD